MADNPRKGAEGVWRLEALMKLRGYRSVRSLQKALSKDLGLSYYQLLRLVNGTFTELPPIDTLDALCFAFKCRIGDLIAIDYTPKVVKRTFEKTVSVTKRQALRKELVPTLRASYARREVETDNPGPTPSLFPE